MPKDIKNLSQKFAYFNCYTLPSHWFIFEGYEIRSVEGTTQGDPVAMAIYTIAVIPLLLIVLEILASFSNNNVNMDAYAHDFTAGGIIRSLKHCWDTLFNLCPNLSIIQRQ